MSAPQMKESLRLFFLFDKRITGKSYPAGSKQEPGFQ
jgi:hypothetical protein